MSAVTDSWTSGRLWKIAAAAAVVLSMADLAYPQIPQTGGEAPGRTSTLLADGRRLLVGGQGRQGPLAAVAIMDPETGRMTELASRLGKPRAWHTATMLPNGTVLILGGLGTDGRVVGQAEVFDPATLSVQLFAAVLRGRAHHSATMLTDGRLLVVGGVSDESPAPVAELWDARTGALSVAEAPMMNASSGHEATLQPDGGVFFSGGHTAGSAAAPTGQVFDPGTGMFAPAAAARVSYAAILEASIPQDDASRVPLDPVSGAAIFQRTVGEDGQRGNGQSERAGQ